MDVDARHDVPVDLADQHHPSHLEGLGIGYSETFSELGLDTQPLHEGSDLRTAAVDNHWPDTHRVHEYDVFGEPGGQVAIIHGVAADLDHHHLAGEPLDVGQGLDKYTGPLLRGETGVRGNRSVGVDVHNQGVAHEVRMFSSM